MGITSVDVPGYVVEAERGRVFQARSRVRSRVALEVLDPERVDGTFTRRFAHEVELARQVHSRHIAAILDADPTANPPWVAMEYVDGPTLQERISRTGRLATHEVLARVRETAQALSDIHAAGIVHRDLKPSNIICGTDGVVRVTDFGIAAAASSTQLTVSGQRIGTLAYTSPEQLRGARARAARWLPGPRACAEPDPVGELTAAAGLSSDVSCNATFNQEVACLDAALGRDAQGRYRAVGIEVIGD